MCSDVSSAELAASEQRCVVVRKLGIVDYQTCWQAMLDFTNNRTADTQDELWFVQHNPVFTQGQAGKAEHLLNPGNIPVVQSDRGGQITYHGPGQLIVYPLIDLRRAKLGVRELVTRIENSVVDTLKSLAIESYPKADAPGVYVTIDGVEHKISSLGLRVRKGCSFHGVAINVDMDLNPFLSINPCGYSGLPMTQVKNCVSNQQSSGILEKVEMEFLQSIKDNLGYNTQQKVVVGLP